MFVSKRSYCSTKTPLPLYPPDPFQTRDHSRQLTRLPTLDNLDFQARKSFATTMHLQAGLDRPSTSGVGMEKKVSSRQNVLRAFFNPQTKLDSSAHSNPHAKVLSCCFHVYHRASDTRLSPIHMDSLPVSSYGGRPRISSSRPSGSLSTVHRRALPKIFAEPCPTLG